MKKRLYMLMLLTFVFPITIYADNRVINGNDYDVYKKTKSDITEKWEIGKIERPSNYNDIYEVLPSYTSPYKAGIVKQSYLNEVLDNLNYYRYIIGVPEVSNYPTNDNELQTAEVVQYASLNSGHYLTHYLYNDFPKPDDMDEEFYHLGAYANHNIIAYGYPTEPNYFFFDESVYDTSNPTAGHRMALLGPEMGQIEYGIGKSVVYGRIHYNTNNYKEMENDFAAYPAPGNFPKQDFAGISDWDVFLNVNKFKALSEEEMNNVIITIKNLTTGTIENRSIADGNLKFDVACYSSYYCPYNRLHILQPNKTSTYYEGNYEVTVSNLKDSNDELVDLKYTVNFYDKFEGVDSDISSVCFDLNLKTVYIDGEYNEEDENEVVDGMNANITLETGSSFDVAVNGFNVKYHYKYSDGGSSYGYYPIIDSLPSWAHDTNKILEKSYLDVVYYQEAENYRFKYTDLEVTKNVGNAVTLLIEDFYSHYDGDVVYIWLKEKNGEMVTLDDESKYSTTGLALTIKNLTKEDEGNYYLEVFLVPKYYYGNRMYISHPINLTIKNPAKGISLDTNNIELNVDETYQITPILNPIDSDSIITYTSSDESTVTVDESGNVVAIKEGTATITVSANGYSKTLTVTVNDYIKGDLNKNNKIDLSDIIMLLKKYLGIETISEEDIKLGDMDNDGVIGLKDIILLLKQYLGLS